MILTHLVIFEFYEGASASLGMNSGFSGFTTHMPHAFFDGFTGTADPEPPIDDGIVCVYIPTFRTRRGR